MRTLQGVVVAGVLTAAALAACSGGSGAADGPAKAVPTVAGSPAGTVPPRTTTGSGPTSPTGATSTPPAPPADPGLVTLAFGGDVNFDGRVAALLTDDGLAPLRPALGSADVSVVNLETAITDRGTPQPKLYHFRTTPQALVTLQRAGVDALSMANNHAVDYGPDGLTDTLAARAASPVPIVGVGRDAPDAFAPAVFTVRGVRVAVVASTQVDDFTVHTFPATDTRPGVAGNLTNTRLLAAVSAARSKYDVVVVFLHWGTDYTTCPDAAQERTVRDLEAAGVDVVVGGHAHRVQGHGWSGRTFVGYGLGNFVWRTSRGPADTWSGVLTVHIDAAAAVRGRSDPGARATSPSLVRSSTWTPLVVGDDGLPMPPTAAQAGPEREQYDAASRCSGLSSSAG